MDKPTLVDWPDPSRLLAESACWYARLAVAHAHLTTPADHNTRRTLYAQALLYYRQAIRQAASRLLRAQYAAWYRDTYYSWRWEV